MLLSGYKGQFSYLIVYLYYFLLVGFLASDSCTLWMEWVIEQWENINEVSKILYLLLIELLLYLMIALQFEGQVLSS